MRAYIISEEQKRALLMELELEKFKTPDQFAITPEQRQAQKDAVEAIHRRFHCIVCRFID